MISTTNAAKAISHPLRAQLLDALQSEASPNDLAVALREPLGNVSYHVRTLLNLGAIELTRTRPVRGALEHFYRATCRVGVFVEPLR